MRIEMEQVEGRRFAIRARGNEVIVDDTIEAGGPGDGFRPSELLMGALAACMAGTMLTFARNQEIPVHGISIDMEDEALDHPDRIGRIAIRMTVDAEATERQQASLERVASACKIHNTLERSPEIELDFTVRT
jgi:putative redox protein